MAPDHPQFNIPFQDDQLSTWSNTFSTPNVSPEPGTPAPPPPSSAAGRKRSRDEAGINPEEDYFAVQEPGPLRNENEEEWEYGEGMTLIKPGRSYSLSAASQTGTWAEEKAEEGKARAAATLQERPIMRSAKSQRRDFASTPAIAEEEIMSNGALVTPVSDSPTNGHAEPTVDDFTRHLGIGWSSISTDEDIQAAARGWTRFINNHFPVTDARIRLQSKGLASYLVEANEGYFLFQEDLKQGKLVSRTLEQTLVNLQGPVPVFEGDIILEATETPTINESNTPMAIEAHVEETSMSGVEGAATNGQAASGHAAAEPTATLEVEMDVS